MWTNFIVIAKRALNAVAGLDVTCQMHSPYDCGLLVVKRNTLVVLGIEDGFHCYLERRGRRSPSGWLTRVLCSVDRAR